MKLRTLAWLALTTCLLGQPQKLTIETVMQGPRFSGYTPGGVRWSGDGKKLYFQWKRYTDAIRSPLDTYTVNRDGSNLGKLSEEEARLAPPVTCDSDLAHQRCVYIHSGDVWLYDFTLDQAKRLTATTDIEMQPRFLPDGKAISYQRAGNLFVHSLSDGSVEQLTDIRSGKPANDEEEPKLDPKKELSSRDFLKQEEKDLLAIIKERAALREENRARQRRENPRKPHYLAPRNFASSLRLSGDRKFVIAIFTERPEGAKEAIVPNYVTESGYTEDLDSRSFVGDLQSRSRIAIINTATGEVRNVDLGLGEKPKTVSPAGIVCSDNAQKCLFLLRSTDNKDLWRMALDIPAAKARILSQDHDDAWIGGPGIVGFGGSARMGFLADDETIYYQSERTGYSHLYTQPFAGGDLKPLTSGNYEVLDLNLSRDKKTFFLTTNEGSPYEHHFYSLDWASGKKVKLTNAVGRHQVTLAPDEKGMADIYSYTTKPDELYVDGKQLTTSPSPDFLSRQWLETPLLEIPARDGKKIPARIFKPAKWKANSPAVLFVHGAGYTQDVHKWWSPNYFREYMFHHILMEAGYLVLEIDYRASAGYGRDWRTGIYRFMGGKDLEDHLDAVNWLVSTQGVHAKKIGIYGGSYGGFLTLMGLFTAPDTFAAGAALRPVTDWAHYNHGYTANILNEPQKDPEAYRKSSPIYHAQGLKGALLICHGMVDVNVHYQDSVRLAQKLIELGKENWELASYPVEDHAFLEPTSWSDEYKRIFRLFEKNLKP
ncbi:prolyl oligopeptidase family serine peptidase [Bryobacter aggregatus]|uniref:prolyl oligopeptidase family serine peptidase n=1 Tax=Bryobacter aggregatus TaxID=360054 RepID=UPI0004E10D2E|nr:prolyl oligopeptidase family serine peptidase [Bryobacter aggregatus]